MATLGWWIRNSRGPSPPCSAGANGLNGGGRGTNGRSAPRHLSVASRLRAGSRLRRSAAQGRRVRNLAAAASRILALAADDLDTDEGGEPT